MLATESLSPEHERFASQETSASPTEGPYRVEYLDDPASAPGPARSPERTPLAQLEHVWLTEAGRPVYRSFSYDYARTLARSPPVDTREPLWEYPLTSSTTISESLVVGLTSGGLLGLEQKVGWVDDRARKMLAASPILLTAVKEVIDGLPRDRHPRLSGPLVIESFSDPEAPEPILLRITYHGRDDQPIEELSRLWDGLVVSGREAIARAARNMGLSAEQERTLANAMTISVEVE